MQVLLEAEFDDEVEQFPGQLLLVSVQGALLVRADSGHDRLLHKLTQTEAHQIRRQTDSDRMNNAC